MAARCAPQAIPACGDTDILVCVVGQAFLPVSVLLQFQEFSGRLGDGRNAVPLAAPRADRNVYPTKEECRSARPHITDRNVYPTEESPPNHEWSRNRGIFPLSSRGI